MLHGIPASYGFAIGKVFLLEDAKKTGKAKPSSVEEEIARFRDALKKARAELSELCSRVSGEVGHSEADIFMTHLLFLEDPMLISATENLIRNEGLSAWDALDRVICELEERFAAMDGSIFRSKAGDVRDVANRLQNIFNGAPKEKIPEGQKVIIVAHELRPSQVASIDKSCILGIIAERGGANSHAAILSRALNIPAVVGVKGAMETLNQGEEVILDGFTGKIINSPRGDLKKTYRRLIQHGTKKVKRRGRLPHYAMTRDGKRIELLANIASLKDLEDNHSGGLGSIGLLRTEFLFMDKDKLPGEDEQAKVYSEILGRCHPHSVTIRLFDLGSDKIIPGIKMPREDNPALGCRGIRLLLKHPEILKAQIRAILKASAQGNAQVMIPMVTTIEEVRQFKELWEFVKEEMRKKKEYFGEIPLGIMIETPSSCLIAESLADQVDFFSLGTNDLTQYTLGVDRENEDMAYMYNHYHPAVLRLIRMAVEAAQMAQIEYTICGEMAQDPLAIPLLLGMGLERLSAEPRGIETVREVVAKIDVHDAYAITLLAMKKSTAAEVELLVREYLECGMMTGIKQ
ncbi:MAG: phosphoenolpyruvate--protein phosphotransferase [Chloroflexi bacterium]|nr:phosphoenolpyruvate--protein phosphotransferase [Chloroflexota bacterium]